MHCAAQTYHGLLSIMVLSTKYNMQATLLDSMKATPLHFAAMFHEIKNVEMLIKLGVDLDAQDC
jgi:hypothetical protein